MEPETPKLRNISLYKKVNNYILKSQKHSCNISTSEYMGTSCFWVVLLRRMVTLELERAINSP